MAMAGRGQENGEIVRAEISSLRCPSLPLMAESIASMSWRKGSGWSSTNPACVNYTTQYLILSRIVNESGEWYDY